MSGRIRVVNTAPLIFLAKLGRLDLLRLGAEIVYVPPAVLAELSAVPDEAYIAVQKLLGDWLHERACTQPALRDMAARIVDLGEAEVIALAIELGTKDVVLDDQDARRFAVSNDLEPIGTLGLLLAAKQNGLIDAIGPELARLKAAGFRASDSLTERIRKAAKEA